MCDVFPAEVTFFKGYFRCQAFVLHFVTLYFLASSLFFLFFYRGEYALAGRGTLFSERLLLVDKLNTRYPHIIYSNPNSHSFTNSLITGLKR